MNRYYFFSLFVLAGCEGEADKPGPDLSGDDTDVACSGAAPIADRLTIGNGGLADFEAVEYPTVSLRLEATDEDGDLDLAYMEFWWDETVDGAVDSELSPQDRYFTLESDSCSTKSVDLNLLLQVGTQLAYNTTYEFAAQVTDYAGMTSNLLVASGSTPKSDGSDGDGSGN